MRPRVLVAAVLTALVAVGCGGDAGAPSTAAPGPVATSITVPPTTVLVTSTTIAPASTTVASTTTTTATTTMPATTTTALELPDIDPPALTVDEWPGEPGFDEAVVLRGTVEDGATVAVNGASANVADGKWLAIVAVDVGVQELQVVARDAAGNEAIEVVTVERLGSADEALADFIAAAEELDERIKEVSDLVNRTIVVDPPGCQLEEMPSPECTVTVPASTEEVIRGLSGSARDRGYQVPLAPDGRLLSDLIPVGLDLETQVAALAVYTDLDSRIAGLTAGALWGPWAWDCFEYGGASAQRFPADLATLRHLAERTSAPTAPRSSLAGLDLATEIYIIHLWNHGCASCGGGVYSGPIDHSHVEVESTWDGTRWQIYIAAC